MTVCVCLCRVHICVFLMTYALYALLKIEFYRESDECFSLKIRLVFHHFFAIIINYLLYVYIHPINNTD